jgi:hypothetical protein
LFHLNTDGATVPAFDVFRLKVTLAYDVTVEAPGSVAAYIRISCNESDVLSVPLYIDWDYSTLPQTPPKVPTEAPSEGPTKGPTNEPTDCPTESPTKDPTEEPTVNPTESPTKLPTEAPTVKPTEELPTTSPTTLQETLAPSSGPTSYPTTDASSVQAPQPSEEQPSLATSGIKLPTSAGSHLASRIVTGFLSWGFCSVLAFTS